MAAALQTRDKRALLLLGAAAAIFALFQLDFFGPAGETPEAVGSIAAAEEKLLLAQVKSRQKPLADAEFAAAQTRLALLEQGMLQSETSALAQAEMGELIGSLLKAEGIDMRGSQFGQTRLKEKWYAEIPLVVDFNCGIEQFVNLMTAIANSPRLLATQEVKVTPANPDSKSVRVRLVVAGYLPADRAQEPDKRSTSTGGLP